MALTGETEHPSLGRERVGMNVHPKARGELRALLFRPEMRGVGYSEFILRAVKAAREELDHAGS